MTLLGSAVGCWLVVGLVSDPSKYVPRPSQWRRILVSFYNLLKGVTESSYASLVDGRVRFEP